MSRPIRVCHVASADLWAGAEVQLAILLSALAGVADLDVSAILFNRGRLADELMQAGIRTHVIPESRHNAVSISRQLSEYFSRNTVDILHTHKCKENVLGAVASVRGGVRFQVRTVHGLPEPFEGLKALRMNVYQALDDIVNHRAVDRILAVSLDMTRKLGRRFGPSKVTCVHNGIAMDGIRITTRSAELRSQLGLSPDDVVIGTLGRLAPVKGLEAFLKAARIIRDQRRVKFVVAGDGPSKGSLEALAHEYRLDDDVLFLGHRDDGHDILALFDMLVLPSLSEGIPMVLLEALALLRPVVASRVGGIPEVIEHGVSGLLVEPGNCDELARSCVTLIDDQQFARRLGRAGRKQVAEQFCGEMMAAKVADVYRQLVRGENADEDWAGDVCVQNAAPDTPTLASARIG